jgi:hypothetical protein
VTNESEFSTDNTQRKDTAALHIEQVRFCDDGTEIRQNLESWCIKQIFLHVRSKILARGSRNLQPADFMWFLSVHITKCSTGVVK